MTRIFLVLIHSHHDVVTVIIPPPSCYHIRGIKTPTHHSGDPGGDLVKFI
jgi:hypothetical protein